MYVSRQFCQLFPQNEHETRDRKPLFLRLVAVLMPFAYETAASTEGDSNIVFYNVKPKYKPTVSFMFKQEIKNNHLFQYWRITLLFWTN